MDDQTPQDQPPQEDQRVEDQTLVVGVGASAGGLVAIEQLLEAMPVDTGLAFVLVTHLDPERPSLLPELLQRKTKMPVREAEDGTQIEANCVYTSAAGMDLSVVGGKLQLSTEPRGSLTINTFFESLAADLGENAIAIVLSGSGSDGAIGVRAIKAAGGMVMAQDSESAEYHSMPSNTMATGLVDYVLEPQQMPSALTNYLLRNKTRGGIDETAGWTAPLQKICLLLRTRTGHDFSLYKSNTIVRRIQRRMTVHQLDGVNDYIRYLRESDREADTLVREVLIGVTSFFRDPEAFGELGALVSRLLADKTTDSPVRVWVAGCATGEEAYSIAILLHECMEVADKHHQVQIFGTDVSSASIDTARLGTYSEAALSLMSPARLKRYFTEMDDGRYQVAKLIREMLVFAPQDIIKDPPFTKLDLLCCRNLLIYFQSELQNRLLPIFHYSLNPGALLFLGSSESVGQHTDLFEPAHKKWKIFRSLKTNTLATTLRLPVSSAISESNADPADLVRPPGEIDETQFMEAILSQQDAPPCVIINDVCDIVYVHGRTGKFLEPAEGKVSVNILDMARPGIRAELVAALRQVHASKYEVIRPQKEIGFGGQRICFNLILTPLDHGPARGFVMVVFKEDDGEVDPSALQGDEPLPSGKSINQLELELRDTRENLQTNIEELQASNEELKSTNEELQSTNEELQSTNEELETSKEELQSLNEESVTVNAELQSRIDELSKTTDDMKNLLDSTDIATVFVDGELRIRSYTPRAVDLLPLQPTDKGRLISNLASNLNPSVDLREIAEQVLDDLAVREVEVTSKDDKTYLLRARPYRTTANMIDGVVLTFENVTELKTAERQLSATALQKSEEKYLQVLRACNSGIVLSNHTGTILGVNPSFCDFLGYNQQELLQLNVIDITHPDSAQRTEDELRKGRERTDGVESVTFEKDFVKKDGACVRARITVTWHANLDANMPMHSIAFVDPI